MLEFDSKPHENLGEDLKDLRFRVGLVNRDEVERHLFAKLVDYLKRKEEKIYQYSQGRQ